MGDIDGIIKVSLENHNFMQNYSEQEQPFSATETGLGIDQRRAKSSFWFTTAFYNSHTTQPYILRNTGAFLEIHHVLGICQQIIVHSHKYNLHKPVVYAS